MKSFDKKTAVILFNLGGPDKLESVEPFLFNLFNDKAIIGLPQPFRFLLAKFISKRRVKKAQKIYQQIMINDIVKYIKENNYFGDKYHIYRDKQIESTKWWISNFYPPSVNLYEKNKDELDKLFKNSQEKLKLEYQKYDAHTVQSRSKKAFRPF